MSADEQTHAARMHRRWHGVGVVLFVVCYSLLFAAHLKFEKTSLYLKDGSFLGANSASFYNDLTGPMQKAGSGGTGKDSAFLLVHHLPTQLLVMAWSPFAGSESAARRHALGSLTSCAGALTAVFLYLALCWAGLGRVRAVVFVGIVASSAALMLAAVVPQASIFSALGLVAALAVVARGREAAWWEFMVAALYAVCCEPWNVLPLLPMALVRTVRAACGGGGIRPFLGLMVSVVLLVVAAFAAGRAQSWVYPAAQRQMEAVAVRQQIANLQQAVQGLPQLAWPEKLQDLWVSNLVGPALEFEQSSRSVQMPYFDWAKFDAKRGVWLAWMGLLALGGMGLLPALRRRGAAVAALLSGAGVYLLHAAVDAPAQRLAAAVLWTPALAFVLAVGTDRLIRRWPLLHVLVMLFSVLFLVFQFGRNQIFITEAARLLAF